MHVGVVAGGVMSFQKILGLWQQEVHHILQTHWRLTLMIRQAGLPSDPMADIGIHTAETSLHNPGPKLEDVEHTRPACSSNDVMSSSNSRKHFTRGSP